ncbi:serine hydrolase [Marivirga tractuosa]|uniref:Beta-lactamase n=1 Tax=Marivirga tractuosa (strain ATCC 23168 / DSM 4126 / NBRC 15989 / NCIMB 1408 / VKM B-1430 / H-43) TaxID=643867 RepID=E4TSJ7_MARTH|nr:serine hydrolase [Marivirga tractuosa]ADR20817.1 beta-lactamase [Marivirga tractuosa DSM 4126]BDD14732.1 serine hydrolase [Marivirga tractuosa]
MKKLILFFIVIATISCSTKKQELEQVSVENSGLDSNKLDSLNAFLRSAGSSSLMILIDGKIAHRYGDVTKKHTVHSIRKSLINSLYGIAIEDGLIDTTATLEDLGIDDIDGLTKKERQATIADLLKSRSGVYHASGAVSKGMLRDMPERGQYAPGEHFYYNNWDFNVLGYILEQATNKSVYQLFEEKIALPIGMQDYEGEFTEIDGENPEAKIPQTDGFYQKEALISKYPAYHFRLSSRDMARYGQLYLQKGKWNGKEIIPETWIEISTKPHSITNSKYGIAYGMLWYVLYPNENRATKSFYHTGTGVHMLGVYPSKNMVLIHRVDTEKHYKFHQGNFYQMISKVFSSFK